MLDLLIGRRFDLCSYCIRTSVILDDIMLICGIFFGGFGDWKTIRFMFVLYREEYNFRRYYAYLCHVSLYVAYGFLYPTFVSI